MTSVAIIDSGGANIASLLYAFQRLRTRAVLTTDEHVIRNAKRVVLPGVGAARDAMERLAEAELIDVIRGLDQPVLGICLGMQLLAESSEEEDVECLGIIPGIARKLGVTPGFPVPNMGWCAIRKRSNHPVLDGLDDGAYFYFVHSYALPVNEYTLAEASHAEPFAAATGRGNFVAAQFHPERSSQSGSQFLRNFLSWAP